MQQHAKQARVLHSRRDLSQVVEDRDRELLALGDVAERRYAPVADCLECELGRALAEQPLLKIRDIETGAARAGEQTHVVVRASRQNLRPPGIDAEVARIEAMLLCVRLELLRSQAPDPLEREHALPE